MTCQTRKKPSKNNNYIINNVSDLSSGTGIQTMTETQPLTLKMKHPFQCLAATCIHWHGCRMGFFFNNVFTLVCFRGPKKRVLMAEKQSTCRPYQYVELYYFLLFIIPYLVHAFKSTLFRHVLTVVRLLQCEDSVTPQIILYFDIVVCDKLFPIKCSILLLCQYKQTRLIFNVYRYLHSSISKSFYRR